ncbi:MAG TPA: GYF domain-containing protein [Candidatus Udaeobacter sp.]
MLDSEFMMLDDQGVTEEWIVRVQGSEYGPVNIETLREWKAEGRLLPANEARRANVDFWTTAAEIPGLFDLPPPVPLAGPDTQPPVQLSRRSFGEILTETLQIYRKGFFQFLGLTLLVLLPSIGSQLTTAFLQPPQGSNVNIPSVLAAGFAFLMFILSIVMWPVYIAGIQILTAEIVRGNRFSLIGVLNEAVRFWPRVAALCVFVYSVFFLLMVFGLAIAAMALAAGSSVLLALVAMGLLILQVWMFGRFFVNVLFWQQFTVLEHAGFIDSLRESRDLARSGRDLPRFQRPLWRGAFIASIWFAVVVALTLAAQWGTLHGYLNQLMTTQDPQALLQQMAEAQKASGFNAFAFALGVIEKILQPLVGIAFVVLYLDSKLERPSHVEPIVRAGEGDTVR